MTKTTCWIALFLIAIVLAGCNYPDQSCQYGDYDDFDIFLDGPAYGAVLGSSPPRFSWHHSEDCQPDHFLVQVRYKEKDGRAVYIVDGSASHLRLDTALAPGGEYYWTVSPLRSSGNYQGKSSPEWIFYTGSSCAGTELRAPQPVGRFLFYNSEGVWLSPHDAYKFEWYYPGDCLPESYYYEFAEDEDFRSMITSGVTSGHRQYIELELPECTSGYWRVAVGNSRSHGPFSEIRRFFWASDESCWMLQVPSIDLARVHGRVYQDYCPETSFFSFSEPSFEGCVSSGFGVHADGRERSWEAGVESALIAIRPGACPVPGETTFAVDPSIPPQTALTDWYGVYEFVVQTPGEYCLSINKDQAEAAINLWRGIWTEPLVEGDVAYKSLTVPAGTHRVFENIGWDDYEYPLMYVEAVTHCRSGDSKAFPPQAFIERQWVPLMGRNREATWLKTWVEGLECYFYYQPPSGEGADGAPSEDEILNLPVFESLPLPEPESEPSESSGKPVDPCTGYPDQKSCVNAGCSWDFNGNPPCTK
jgi:hypothetical protein